MLWEDSGGVLSSAGLPEELLLFSFLGAVELGASSGLDLMVFNGFVAEEESFFLVTTPSPVFFFTFSLLAFTPSVLTLAFTFWLFSFFVLSA